MKIAMINGQNHKGSTYHIGKMLADKLGGEVTEFFLPKDFGHFCIGCNQYKSGICLSLYRFHESMAGSLWLPVDAAQAKPGYVFQTGSLYFYRSRRRNEMDQQRYGRQYVFLGNGKDIQVRYCRSCHKL